MVFLVAAREMAQRQMLADLVKQMGLGEVLTAASGTTAWALIKQHGVDFIISTIQLQEIDGLALLKIVRADSEYLRTPFLMLAEVVTRQEVIEAGEAGVSELLCRPLSPARISDKIAELLGRDQEKDLAQAQKHFEHGLRLMEEERWEEALISFNRVISAVENAEVYYNLGYINAVLERYEQAIVYFRKATEIDGACARAYQKMSECFLALGEKEKARNALDQAVSIYLEKEGEGESRDEIIQEVAKANPDTINIYNTLGILYRRQGRYQEAAQQYTKALKVHPDDENIYFNLGRCLNDAGELPAALEALDKALQINPEFGEARTLRTVVQSRL